MDRYAQLKEDFSKAKERLQAALKEAHNHKHSELFEYFRDSAIQRFEFTFEIFWKVIKFYLKELHGVECYSPKSCLRELFTVGIANQEETYQLLHMVDWRNLTVHTYKEALSEEIFEKIPSFLYLMNSIFERLP